MLMTANQFREFAATVIRSLPDNIESTTAQWWIQNQENLRKVLRDTFTSSAVTSAPRSLQDDLDLIVTKEWVEDQENLRKVLHMALAPYRKPTKYASMLPEASTYNAISVNYGRSVESLTKAGFYNWSDSDVTSKNFPTNQKGISKIKVEIIHFNRCISTDEALQELNKLGYRPAELRELLVFGEKYPKVQCEFPIVALGSVWKNPSGHKIVPYLYKNGRDRNLCLHWIDFDWYEIYRFAAVRK